MTNMIICPAIDFIREARTTDPHLAFTLLLTDDGSSVSYALLDRDNHHLLYLSTLEYTSIRALFAIERLGSYKNRAGKQLTWYKVKDER